MIESRNRAPLLRTAILLSTVPAVSTAVPDVALAQAPGSPETMIVREIERLDDAWLGASLTRDAEAVRPILTDDFHGQLGDVAADKAAILERVSSSTTVAMTLERRIVKVYGDIAVAHAIRSRTDRAEDGSTVTSRFAYTDVYRWDGDAWRSFTGQSASLPPAS